MIAADLQSDCSDPVETLGEILLCRPCSPGPMQSPPMFPRSCAHQCVFVYSDWPCHQPCILVKNHEGAHRCMQQQTAVDQALPQQETKHSSKTRRSLMPDALEEAWKTRVDRRKVDVAKGKETAEYRAYSTKVPRAAREESAPRTPDARDVPRDGVSLIFKGLIIVYFSFCFIITFNQNYFSGTRAAISPRCASARTVRHRCASITVIHLCKPSRGLCSPGACLEGYKACTDV